jgi:hypothetical protein
MESLGEPEISLSFEASGAGQHDGEACHKKARAMGAPNIGVYDSRGGKVKQPIFTVSTESLG